MKNKGLLITIVVFFLLINTTYYWEGKLGLFAFPAFISLIIVYLGLVIAFIRRIFFAAKEKFAEKRRIYTVGLLVIVLTLTFYKPFGLIDFEKFEGDDLLVAQREGSANCTTTFKLKDDFTFREKNICFGITEVKGIYRISNDTIYFDNVKRGKQEDVKYEFGVIEEPQLYTEHPFALRLFKDKKDRIGFFYWIANNKLKIKPIIKPNR